MNSPSGKRKGRPTEPVPGWSSLQRVVLPLVAVAVVVLSLAVLANSMTKPLGRDEHMYCTGGVLLARGELIYRDFPYISHPPYHPLFLAGLYRVLPTSHYLLAARLFSVLCGVLVILLIVEIYRQAFGRHRAAGLLCGLAAAVLYVFNPAVDYASGYAWNHDLVILCVIAAFWVFSTTNFQQGSRRWPVAVIGGLTTLAACVRITTAPVALLFLAAVLMASKGGIQTRLQAALPFLAAALVVLAWPIWAFTQAPRAMWLDLVQIPALCADWLRQKGFIYDKTQLTLIYLATPAYLVLLGLLGWLSLATAWRWPRLTERERRNAVVAALLAVMFFIITYIPPAMWQQYLAVPVPFAVVALAFPLAISRRRADETGRKRLFAVPFGATAIGAAVAFTASPTILYRSPAVLAPEQWTPIRLHRVARDVAAHVPQPGHVLTLGPLYILEGGGEIYRELANPFTYRVADALSAEDRAITHTIGPATLPELVRQRPPAAVLVGVEPPYLSILEDPLRRLIPPDWHGHSCDALQLYSPPQTPRASPSQ